MGTRLAKSHIPRRQFLQRASVAVGATALAACSPPGRQATIQPTVEEAMENRFLLGVSTSVFPGKSISPQEYALLGQYGVASVEIGYEQVGPALSDLSLLDELVFLVRDAQPAVFSLHAPYRPYRDLSLLDEDRRRAAVGYTEAALELASQLGAELVVIHGSENPISTGTRADRLAQSRQSLADLVPKAKALNLRLALETMPPEWLPVDVDEAFDVVEDLDPEVVGFCLDTNHSNLTNDLREFVHALGARLWNVHISDNDGRKQQHWMPFQGVIDWGAFMAALDEVNYAGPLHYELDPHPLGAEQGLQEAQESFERLLALAPSPHRPNE